MGNSDKSFYHSADTCSLQNIIINPRPSSQSNWHQKHHKHVLFAVYCVYTDFPFNTSGLFLLNTLLPVATTADIVKGFRRRLRCFNVNTMVSVLEGATGRRASAAIIDYSAFSSCCCSFARAQKTLSLFPTIRVSLHCSSAREVEEEIIIITVEHSL